ncbi:hypothetical protein ONZ45_g3526 [Pleurotus djamor]|nr:hypothetical protein ONZ45_g3526 [Pleurotus djamor]
MTHALAKRKVEETCRRGDGHGHYQGQERLPPRYVDKLMPPNGTSFYRFQSFTPVNGPITDKSHKTFLDLQWNIDAHVYVVRAVPGDDFVTNGGAVFVALVHGGSAKTGTPANSSLEYRYTVTAKGAGRAITQLPSSNTGVVNEDNTNYPIKFTQEMQMFRQNATEAFTFPAQYENSIDYYKGEQTGIVQGNGVQWSTKLEKSIDTGANFPFGGFSLFRSDSLDSISFECTAAVYQHRAGTDWHSGPTLKASQTATININIPLSAYEPLKDVCRRENSRGHHHEVEHPPPRYVNRLRPPYGTSFFRLQTFTPINGGISNITVSNYLNLQWHIDAYIYVVGAPPGDDFVANGGAVYVALVHGGSATAGRPVFSSYEYRYSVTPKGAGRAITQLPVSNTGVVNGDNTNYPIVFSQEMQMFRQNATEAFTFPAQYESSIDYHKGEQTGIVRGNGVQWSTRFNTTLGYFESLPFGGFSLFRSDSLAPISFECTAAAYQWSDMPVTSSLMASRSATITIDLPVSRYEQRHSKL